MTKKEIQKKENTQAKRKFTLYMKDFDNAKYKGQLRQCNAYIYETEKYLFLRSYKTIVAVINKNTNELVDVLRLVYGYTSSSSKQIDKFREEYKTIKRLTYKNV